MASSLFVDFHADVLALTQGNPRASLLPLLKQLKGWDEVRRKAACCDSELSLSVVYLAQHCHLSVTLAPPTAHLLSTGAGRG